MKIRRTQGERVVVELDVDEAEHLFNVLTAAEINAPEEASRFAARLQVELGKSGVGPHSREGG